MVSPESWLRSTESASVYEPCIKEQDLRHEDISCAEEERLMSQSLSLQVKSSFSLFIIACSSLNPWVPDLIPSPADARKLIDSGILLWVWMLVGSVIYLSSLLLVSRQGHNNIQIIHLPPTTGRRLSVVFFAICVLYLIIFFRKFWYLFPLKKKKGITDHPFYLVPIFYWSTLTAFIIVSHAFLCHKHDKES